jgi:predicted N-acetyltransferase YhbS
MITFKYYEDKDFYTLEQFILNSYTYDVPAWGLARHEFCRALHPDFKNTHHMWTESMGVFLDNGNIISAVISEGAYDGDAFFLFDSKARGEDIELLKRMVKFAITHLYKIESDNIQRTLHLYVPNWHTTLRDLVLSMGFTKEDYEEASMHIDTPNEPFIVKLPEGYHFNTNPVPAFYLSHVHRHAFGYELPYAEQGSTAFSKLRTMRHYDPKLEVVVLDNDGRPVAFGIGWMDESMPYAELEPLGVVWWERRKGLGKAVIYELCNRIKAKYPHVKSMTGGDQPFYAAIGFKTKSTTPRYQFQMKIYKSWDARSKTENYRF